MTTNPTEVWNEMLGDCARLTDFVERYILSRSAPIVLWLDEVDNIFSHSYYNDFFAMLRAWHNRRSARILWNQINLLIVHSTEPALFIKDLNQSPFNVGASIRLGDFNNDEVLWLNARHGSPLKSAADMDCLFRLVGGHPYLVRQALYALSSRHMPVTELETLGADDSGPFGDHLRRQLWVLRENPLLRKALKQVINGRGCKDEDSFQRLRAAGLIVGQSRERAKARCDLYTAYMKRHL